MKLTLTITTLLLACAAWGQTNVTMTATNNPVINAFIEAVSSNGFDTDKFLCDVARIRDENIYTNALSDLILGDITVCPVVITLSDKILSGEVTLSDDAIRALATSGAICEVLGHERVVEDLGVNHLGKRFERRECRLCGETETREVWK